MRLRIFPPFAQIQQNLVQVAQMARSAQEEVRATRDEVKTVASETSTSASETTEQLGELHSSVLTLRELSQSYAQALPASLQDRAALHQRDRELTARLDALDAAVRRVPTLTGGPLALTATVLAGATFDAVVPLAPALPDDAYVATASVVATAPQLLGRVTVDGVIARTASSVTVRLRNGGLTSVLATGLSVHVIAFRP